LIFNFSVGFEMERVAREHTAQFPLVYNLI
jgi:hypothetical protein